MSNNKQSMKLYTHEEIVNFLNKEFADEINAETFMENLTPIELPSDEEIDKQAEHEDTYSKKALLQEAQNGCGTEHLDATMSNNKQSSVEWLYEKMFVNHGRITIEEFEQAKAMHQEEIINATIYGDRFEGCYGLDSEQYYNETYGGNNEQQSIPTITLKKIERIDTRDVLYDIKLKQFCVYPKDIDLKTVDIVYIKKNCLKLSIIPNN